jgi:hypothetical protein
MAAVYEENQRRNARRRSQQNLSAVRTDPEYTQNKVGLTPFIRENDVNFAVKNLKPDTAPNYFFDDIKVNNFCQRASIINVASSSVLSTVKINQGIYGLTSKAYAEVLGTSLTATQNLIYVNDNFLTIRVERINDALTADDFKVDELVYQTVANSPVDLTTYTGLLAPQFTFLGKVKKWDFDPSNTNVAYLVVEPLNGRANVLATSATSHNIWNLSRGYLTTKFAKSVQANQRFQASETLLYSANGTPLGTSISTTNAYSAFSSIVPGANTANSPNRSIMISTNNISRDGISSIIGNTISIVSGTNMGFSANVLQVVSNTAVGCLEAIVDATLPANCTSNSVYSIGTHKVNDVGSLFGIFHIPSQDKLRWLTGERVFTVTDTATYNDNGYKMRAVAKYTALGKINSTENARNFVLREQTPSNQQAVPSILQETQKINDRKYMAQTFFTPKSNEIVNGQVKNTYGIFLTSIDLFFKSKPVDTEEYLPFTLALCKVENGLPSNSILAESTRDCALIRVSDKPSIANTSTATRFYFDDPVYLLPSTEYAIKLITESPDYEVWTATMGAEYEDENANIRKVSDQPYVGNFFTSQNASNWNPILNKDLMFQINRASFEGSKELYFTIAAGPELTRNIVMDAVKISATEQQFAPTSIKYELKSLLTDSTTVADFIKLDNNEIYSFGKDTDISSVDSKRRRLIPVANTTSLNVKVTMSTSDSTVSPILNQERFGLFTIQNIINNAGISNNLISIVNSGTHINPVNINVEISEPDFGSNRATANVTPALFSGGKVLGINIINPGSGYFSTPTIKISEIGSTSNATAVINGETDASGGNILAKYQTKVVTLADGFDSGDLVVKMEAIKPSGTEIAVYFKVLSALDNESITVKKWQKMYETTNPSKYSPDQVTKIPIEFRQSLTKGQVEYFDGGKSYPLGGSFKYFAIKIRMTAQDPTVVPFVESLKVIAVPGEVPLKKDVDGGLYAGTV